MDDLQGNRLNGYILAKAVRLPAIAFPNDVYWFDLDEYVEVDEIITSYMLNANFVDFETTKRTKNYINWSTTPYDTAIRMYKRAKIFFFRIL